MYKNSFDQLLKSIEISNPDEPLKNRFESDSETSLLNPYSKVTCFILYLYSMEFGDPPLYAEANRIARDMDMDYLKYLGPFLRVLSACTNYAEINRDGNDKKKTGQEIQNEMIGNPSIVDCNLSGAFMLFRGVKLLPEHLMKWEFGIGQRYNMPGNSSCSENLMVALQFAL